MDNDFEQNHYSRTAKGTYRIGHDSIRLKKWVADYDKPYENINYFDLMASLLEYFNKS